jgi:hypothetical protein
MKGTEWLLCTFQMLIYSFESLLAILFEDKILNDCFIKESLKIKVLFQGLKLRQHE